MPFLFVHAGAIRHECSVRFINDTIPNELILGPKSAHSLSRRNYSYYSPISLVRMLPELQNPSATRQPNRNFLRRLRSYRSYRSLSGKDGQLIQGVAGNKLPASLTTEVRAHVSSSRACRHQGGQDSAEFAIISSKLGGDDLDTKCRIARNRAQALQTYKQHGHKTSAVNACGDLLFHGLNERCHSST